MSSTLRWRVWSVSAIIGFIAAFPVLASTSERGLRIRNFEQVQALPLLDKSRDGHPEFALRLKAYGRDFTLRLKPNDHLASPTPSGTVQLFAGTIDGLPGSWARISRVSGATRGMFFDGAELYLVDSARILGAASAASLGPDATIIYRLADTMQGTRDAARQAFREVADAPQAPATVSYRIDVSALADADFRALFPDDQKARDEILVRLNNVDGLFSAQLGVQIHVASVDIDGPSTANLSTITNASALLSKLADERLRNPGLRSHAVNFLFTGREFDDHRVGLAYTRTLCSPVFSVGLARSSVNSGLDSLIAAHEIAHVLGAPHDGEKACSRTPTSRFLMTPSLISSESVFSSCSLENMRPAIQAASCVVALNGPVSTPGRALAATSKPRAAAAEMPETSDSDAH